MVNNLVSNFLKSKLQFHFIFYYYEYTNKISFRNIKIVDKDPTGYYKYTVILKNKILRNLIFLL